MFSRETFKSVGKSSNCNQKAAKSSVNSEVKRQSRLAIESLLKGDTSQTESCVSSLVRLVDSGSFTDDDVVSEVLGRVSAPRPWKKLLRGNEEIRAAIFESEYGKSAIYSKEQQTDVREDFKLVVERWRGLAERMRLVLGVLGAVVEDSTEGVMVLSLVEDLCLDLDSLVNVISSALVQVNRVDCLSRMYDSLAENFNTYEVAGRFVERVSERLCEPND